MPPINRQHIRRARTRLQSAEAAVLKNSGRLADARATLDQLRAQGAADNRIATAETRVKELEASHRSLAHTVVNRRRSVLDLSEAVFANVADPEELVASLNGRLPVVLLPVRLETRFVGKELRIRVFPDQIHLDGHEQELTEDEVEAGKRYWRARWTDATSDDPWTELTSLLEAPRARWVVDQMVPGNVADMGQGEPDFPSPRLKAEDWTQPARARLLPDRWVAIGTRGKDRLFTKWGRAIPDSLEVTPTPDPLEDPNRPDDPQEDLLFDDPMRWLVEYDEAVKVGMAITILPADIPGRRTLQSGIDELVVLGVDWTLTPGAGATSLEEILTNHRHTEAFGFIPPGTATNSTSTARSGFQMEDIQNQVLDPARSVELVNTCASRRLARALGLNETALDGSVHGERRDADTASALHDVLWASTLGHFLEDLFDPLIDERAAQQTRRHAGNWLLPGGPFGALRVGNQPYGVLPCVPPQRFRSRDSFEVALLKTLQSARPAWTAAVARVPRMGRTGDTDTDLLELLQLSPLAEVARFRRVLGPAAVANSTGLEGASRIQAIIKEWLRRQFGWPEAPRLFQMTAHPDDERLPVPWVQNGELAEGAPLDPPYLATIAQLAQSLGGREQLRQLKTNTILQALVAHAAVEEIDRIAASLVEPFRVDAVAADLRSRAPRQPRLPSEIRLAIAELLGVEEASPPTAANSVMVSTQQQLAQLVIPSLTGSMVLADFVAHTATESPETSNLTSFISQLRWLSARPAPDIERAFCGFLDATSHRLDSWYTSLATRRLASVREKNAKGVHLGGFGWLHDVRRDTRPDSLGYIHAPSIAHATTAAILRSGHLAHRDDEHEALDIDLSSDRVQLALPVLEGVAAGQSLAALIGYRFERRLRDTDLRLAKFILPFRRIAPLVPAGDTSGNGAVESIAERDVVDGVKLLENWEMEGAALFGRLSGTAPSAEEREQLADTLDSTASIYDAVSDVMVAEAVHQTALGNYERAGAALAALDKQERPPFPEVVRTPRTGTDYTQRVAIIMGNAPQVEGWRSDARSRAEPRLNAWVAAMLPDPGRIRILARTLDQPGSPLISVSAADLGLSPLSLVMSVGEGGQVLTRDTTERAAKSAEHRAELSRARALDLSLPEDPDGPSHELAEMTLLEEWAAFALAAEANVSDGLYLEDTLAILDEDPSDVSGGVGLGAFRALLKWIHTLVTEARAANAQDLAPPSAEASPGYDLVELAQRADAAVAELNAAVAKAKSALESEDASRATLRSALKSAAAVGSAEAVPRHVTGGTPAEVRSSLRTQLEGALADLVGKRARGDALVQGFAADGVATEEAALKHHRARIRALFGEGFPVLPRFRIDHVEGLEGAVHASLVDAALTDGDLLAARAWIDRLSPVQPGVDRLGRVLTVGELLGSQGSVPGAVAVTQLPHVPGERWLALPFPESGPSEAEVASVLHVPFGINPAGFMAGMVCAEWTERIPSGKETTAVSFHYDAPAARAPQVVLIAVPPDMDQASWSLDTLLETVVEASQLAKMRGVTFKELHWLGAMLPSVYLPDNLNKDRPSVDLIGLAAQGLLQTQHLSVLGKED